MKKVKLIVASALLVLGMFIPNPEIKAQGFDESCDIVLCRQRLMTGSPDGYIDCVWTQGNCVDCFCQKNVQ